MLIICILNLNFNDTDSINQTIPKTIYM